MCCGQRKHDCGLNPASLVNLHYPRETSLLGSGGNYRRFLVVINPPRNGVFWTQIRGNGHAGSIHDMEHRNLNFIQEFVIQDEA